MRNPSDRRATWAAYVKRLREVTGLSRPEFARRLNVDPATVWRWETEKQKPESPDVPEAIARLFGLDVDEVLAAAGLKLHAAAADESPQEPSAVDDEIELVRSDPDLDPDMKIRIVTLITERRARERETALTETQRLIDLMKRRGA